MVKKQNKKKQQACRQPTYRVSAAKLMIPTSEKETLKGSYFAQMHNAPSLLELFTRCLPIFEKHPAVITT